MTSHAMKLEANGKIDVARRSLTMNGRRKKDESNKPTCTNDKWRSIAKNLEAVGRIDVARRSLTMNGRRKKRGIQ